MSRYCSSINTNRQMESLLKFLNCAAKSIEKTHVFESSFTCEMPVKESIAGLYAAQF